MPLVREEVLMREVRSVNSVYTLYEDDDGSFVLDLVVPAAKSAWVNYEKRVFLNTYEKIMIKMFPERADRVASRLITEEMRRQKRAH